MKLKLATIFAAISAAPAFAGGLSPALMEVPEIIPAEPASSLAGWLIPLIILILLVAIPKPETCTVSSAVIPNPCP